MSDTNREMPDGASLEQWERNGIHEGASYEALEAKGSDSKIIQVS